MRQAIARALMRCQRQPLPAPEAAAIRVNYRVTLNQDGSLAGAQLVSRAGRRSRARGYERRMRASRSTRSNACTPFAASRRILRRPAAALFPLPIRSETRSDETLLSPSPVPCGLRFASPCPAFARDASRSRTATRTRSGSAKARRRCSRSPSPHLPTAGGGRHRRRGDRSARPADRADRSPPTSE